MTTPPERRSDEEATDVGKRTTRDAPLPRRAVLRGISAAVPTILTLSSGAALARSSNLISYAEGMPTDAQNRALCLDATSIKEQVGPNLYDLGEPASPGVTRIPTQEKQFFSAPDGQGQAVSVHDMCQNGGTYYYEDSGGSTTLASKSAPKGVETIRKSFLADAPTQGSWQQVNVPRGGLVSATALASFTAAGIRFTDI